MDTQTNNSKLISELQSDLLLFRLFHKKMSFCYTTVFSLNINTEHADDLRYTEYKVLPTL